MLLTSLFPTSTTDPTEDPLSASVSSQLPAAAGRRARAAAVAGRRGGSAAVAGRRGESAAVAGRRGRAGTVAGRRGGSAAVGGRRGRAGTVAVRRGRAGTVAVGTLAVALAGLALVPAAHASAATPRCHTSQLAGRVGTPLHAAGSTYAPIVLRNASGSTCHVRGYPGIGLVGNGGDIAVNPLRDASLARTSKRTLTLRPGAHASAVLRIAGCAGGGGAREGLRGLIVTPPDERDHLRIRSSRLGWYCGGPTSIGVLVRGSRGIRL